MVRRSLGRIAMKRTGLPALIVIALLIGCAAELENPEDFMNPGGVGGGGAGCGGATGGACPVPIAGCGGATGGMCPGGCGGATGGSCGDTGVPPPCDAPTLVFNVPDTMGGCQGALCHQNVFPPELHTPGVAARLLDINAALCPNTVTPIPKYIDSANPANSFILNKVQAAMPTCGAPMPYMPNTALSAEKLACLVEWVNSVAGQ